ncbi:hypothetical protein KOI40_17655 [Aestuariicella sp. G3-2]|nr:hypothetical protein [Aestuariicella albida]MBU3071658.1 hypothetical protein [Aestuariicella albida]
MVRMWPGIDTAEDEVIQRLILASKKIDVEVIVINTSGELLDEPSRKIGDEDVDFVIHLHFETPKTYDAFSFVALWNPIDFYFEWGYRKYSSNLVTHDDFLSCGSASSDDHIKRLCLPLGTHLEPDLHLFHSLATPILEPTLGEKKIFYVGINWERLGKGEGRHSNLLKALDETGQLEIYGPEVFQGINVWDGYKSFKGGLPFDGVSVIHAIHKAGITLALSSSAHVDAGLMSSRLFEGVAAGSVVIVDENEFARKNFAETLLYIKTIGESPESITSQVKMHLEWINSYPEEALKKARDAQNIFLEKFEMASSLDKIYKKLPERKKLLAEKYLNKTKDFKLVVFGFLNHFNKENFLHLVSGFEKQTYGNKKLELVVDTAEYEANKNWIMRTIGKCHNVSCSPYKLIYRDNECEPVKKAKWGKVFYDLVVKYEPGVLVSIIFPNECIFSEHYSSLIRSFEDEPELELSYTDVLLMHRDKDSNKFYSTVEGVEIYSDDYNNPSGFSRFLFKVPKDDWFSLVIPYLNFSVMDAVYCKSKIKKRVGRASCIIDIQNLCYQHSEMRLLNNDKQILLDVLNINERKPFEVSLLQEKNVGKDYKYMSMEDNRILLASMFDSLPLPDFFKRNSRRLLRLVSKLQIKGN